MIRILAPFPIAQAEIELAAPELSPEVYIIGPRIGD